MDIGSFIQILIQFVKFQKLWYFIGIALSLDTFRDTGHLYEDLVLLFMNRVSLSIYEYLL